MAFVQKKEFVKVTGIEEAWVDPKSGRTYFKPKKDEQLKAEVGARGECTTQYCNETEDCYEVEGMNKECVNNCCFYYI